ncbi:hypothetical protein L1887_04297 [Cichorium endivia]|nr:hypothetical protein L1887_04297 [Cichorium endivia]
MSSMTLEEVHTGKMKKMKSKNKERKDRFDGVWEMCLLRVRENERQQKVFQDEIERTSIEAQQRISEAEVNYSEALEYTWIGVILVF